MACLQGIYVLQDNNFRWLLRLAPASAVTDGGSRAEYLAQAAQPYLELPCGLIRGEGCDLCSLVKRLKLRLLHSGHVQQAG